MFDIDLGKWPRLLALGKILSIEQTYEVIVKTTNLWNICTNSYSLLSTNRLLKLMSSDNFTITSEKLYSSNIPEEDWIFNKELDYLHNSQFYSSWIGGRHGWLNWNGTIRTSNYNIGKWPSVNDVLNDVITLKTQFPFLDVTFQLVDITEEDKDVEIHTPLVEYTISPDSTDISIRTQELKLLLPVERSSFTNILNLQPFCWDEDLLKHTCDRLRKEKKQSLAITEAKISVK
jgi:hypothetical protein